MNKYKKLLYNSGVFAIGNFGSKLITFLLVPLYTYTLTKVEYGESDYYLTLVQLFLPIASLSISQAVIRYTLDKNEEKSSIFINSILISVSTGLLLTLILIILKTVGAIEWPVFLISIIVLSQMIQQILAQFVRGINQIKSFAISSIIYTFGICISNIFLLVILHQGIVGFLISQIVGPFFSSVYLIFSQKLWKYAKVSSISCSYSFKLVKYSAPLVPNMISWWLINGANRIFIMIFLGVGANGLFAVATKLPGMINLLTSIFQQAWFMSSVEENDSKDKEEFYSTVFSCYFSILFIALSTFLVILKWIMHFMVEKSYFEAWQYMPLLLIAAVYGALNIFFSQIYMVADKTMGNFKTSSISAMISLILNIFLIPAFGLYGAATTQALSWIIMTTYRYFDTKKILCFAINKKYVMQMHFVVIVQVITLYIDLDNFENIIQIFFLVIGLLISKKQLKGIFLI
ncbi:hypothetical protein IGI66_002310 [Enterococcus sp. AZ048]|uniref:oligosaccharide flippase family protein n=1 Tax=Enterococcus sp. AZ048 TaxID=2774658 RepID=UPI003F21186B